MKIIPIKKNSKLKKIFLQLTGRIYKHNKFYYKSSENFNYLLLDKKNHYDKKFIKINHLVQDELNVLGRFTIFIDRKSPKTIFIGFFEFIKNGENPIPNIIEYIKNKYGKNKKIIWGINGSFFYGAGFLMDDYLSVPSFGTVVTKEYYNNFFVNFNKIPLHLYKLNIKKINKSIEDFQMIFKKKSIKFVSFSKSEFPKATSIITAITNNAYNTSVINRTMAPKWDLNFFMKLKSLIPKENIIIIEQNGKYVGGLVFIYNINEIITHKQDINAFNLAKYNIMKKWKTAKIIRFAINTHCKNSYLIADGLLLKAFSIMRQKGVQDCEIGPFFESDKTYTNAITSYMQKINKDIVYPKKNYNIYIHDES